MIYEEIRTKQGISYISFCPLRILYNSKFIIMATFMGTNAVVVTRVHCTLKYMTMWKCVWIYADSIGPNRPVHLGSLIRAFTIGIKHGYTCINICQVPWEVLKTKAGRGFQYLPRDLVNVNALKNHVWSLLLHKNWKHLLHFALFLALFCFAFSPMSREHNFHGLRSF